MAGGETNKAAAVGLCAGIRNQVQCHALAQPMTGQLAAGRIGAGSAGAEAGQPKHGHGEHFTELHELFPAGQKLHGDTRPYSACDPHPGIFACGWSDGNSSGSSGLGKRRASVTA